jgi:hypothetical protein
MATAVLGTIFLYRQFKFVDILYTTIHSTNRLVEADSVSEDDDFNRRCPLAGMLLVQAQRNYHKIYVEDCNRTQVKEVRLIRCANWSPSVTLCQVCTPCHYGVDTTVFRLIFGSGMACYLLLSIPAKNLNFLLCLLKQYGSWGSSVSTVPDYRLDQRGSIPGRRKLYLF